MADAWCLNRIYYAAKLFAGPMKHHIHLGGSHAVQARSTLVLGWASCQRRADLRGPDCRTKLCG
jgi:hypothetical protein